MKLERRNHYKIQKKNTWVNTFYTEGEKILPVKYTYAKKGHWKSACKGNKLYACNHNKNSTVINMHVKTIYFMFKNIKVKYCTFAKCLK